MPPSRHLLFVYHPNDRNRVFKYSEDLRRRGFTIGHESITEFELTLSNVATFHTKILFVWTASMAHEKAIIKILKLLNENFNDVRDNIAILMIDTVELEKINAFHKIGSDYETYDLSFEQVLRWYYEPIPPWLNLYCRPSQILQPTGADWWNNTIIVADEYYGHLLRIEESDTSVLLAGLDEPYHIDIDRRFFAVSNLGTNSIIHGRIQPGGVVANVSELQSARGIDLSRPHGVFQGCNYSLIADTDNHRVLWKKGHLYREEFDWHEWNSNFRFPCGIYFTKGGAWVADTFNHRLVMVKFESNNIVVNSTINDGINSKMSFPVCVYCWKDFLFVSDEDNKRLQVFKVGLESQCTYIGDIGSQYIVSPMGMGINMNSWLVVADRVQGCCWAVDLKAWFFQNGI